MSTQGNANGIIPLSGCPRATQDSFPAACWAPLDGFRTGSVLPIFGVLVVFLDFGLIRELAQQKPRCREQPQSRKLIGTGYIIKKLIRNINFTKRI